MRSFRDPTTGVLKSFGFVESNAPGDLMRCRRAYFKEKLRRNLPPEYRDKQVPMQDTNN